MSEVTRVIRFAILLCDARYARLDLALNGKGYFPPSTPRPETSIESGGAKCLPYIATLCGQGRTRPTSRSHFVSWWTSP